MTEIPETLRKALAERQLSRRKSDRVVGENDRVAVGDLRVMSPLAHRGGVQRIGLVVRVENANNFDQFVEVLLAHSSPEFATDSDVIMPKELSAAPYDLVIQSDLRAPVWTFQMKKAVGQVAPKVLSELLAQVGTHRPIEAAEATTNLLSGMPLRGPRDGRWSFKEAEGDALRALSDDCTDALLEDGFDWQVDQRLLRPELLALAQDREALLLELLHWLQTRPLDVRDEDIEVLIDAGVLDPSAWSILGDVGAALFASVHQGLIEKVATRPAGDDRRPQESQGVVTAAHLGLHEFHESTTVVHYLGNKELVPS